MEKEKYLVVNAGSSSLKFSLYEMPEQNELVNVYVEKIGSKDCFWTLKMNGEKIKKSAPLKDHSEAVQTMMQELVDNKLIENIDEIKGVGHRVVHGGEFYAESVKFDAEVLANIEMRDRQDKNKEIGSLKVADGATVIDTTNLSIEEVAEKIKAIVKNKM